MLIRKAIRRMTIIWVSQKPLMTHDDTEWDMINTIIIESHFIIKPEWDIQVA